MVKIFNNAIYKVLGAHRFAEGGSMNTDETDRPISQSRRDVRGVNEFNAGGSHEENPYGGVPQGVAPDGAPNLVEQGEVKLSDIIGMDNQYILSNRIIIDAEHAQQFNIPESVVGMTYAAAFKKLYQPLKERSGSTEVKNEIAHLANAFMQAQDSVKAEQEAQQASAIMNSLSPEERQQMMQMAQQQGGQGQPSPEEQQMMQQQMMAQQQGQLAQDPSMMGGQQMPPEAMGGQPSPEEMAMMQQQDPSMMGGQQPMMARGGRMINRFSKGGNMKFNTNMFDGVFSHKFAGGGNLKPDEVKGIPDNYFYDFDKDYTAGVEKKVEDGKVVAVRRNGGPWIDVADLSRDIDFSENNHWVTHINKDNKYELKKADLAPNGVGYARLINTGRDYEDDPRKVSEEDAEALRRYVRDGMPEPESYRLGYSGGADIPIFGKVGLDMNPEFDSRGQERALKQSPTSKKQNPLAALSVDELARLVINGKLGSGKSRKEALGDRYSEVQKRVNELLSGSKKKATAKKVKINDERGGKKVVEIPSWVGRSDEDNL